MTTTKKLLVKKANAYIELFDKNENYLDSYYKESAFHEKAGDFTLMRWYQNRARISERIKSRIEDRINELLKLAHESN